MILHGPYSCSRRNWVACKRLAEVDVIAPSKPRRIIALCVAVGLDATQILLFPMFGEGFASPANDVVDGLAFIFFWRLIGWHFALLPSFIIKIIPVIDLAPTWTSAVFIATRTRQEPHVVKVLPRPNR